MRPLLMGNNSFIEAMSIDWNLRHNLIWFGEEQRIGNHCEQLNSDFEPKFEEESTIYMFRNGSHLHTPPSQYKTIQGNKQNLLFTIHYSYNIWVLKQGRKLSRIAYS